MPIDILLVKNMVCHRCILAVEDILLKSGISFQQVTAGEIHLEEKISDEKMHLLSGHLAGIGLELIDNRVSGTIEKIKQLKLNGLEQVGLEVVTSALESIMRQILTNAGFNGLEKVMNAKASPEGYGVDIDSGEIVNMVSKGVLDPVLVKTMALEASGEMAKSVLRIDKNLAADDLNSQALSDSRR